MVKSRNNRTSSGRKYIQRITKTSKRVLPIVDKSLTRVGVVAKDLTKKSIPIVEKGVSVIYGTMATGFDLGVKGARGVMNTMTKNKKSKHKRHHKRTHKRRR
jgi:hypothetical protein